MIFFVLVLLLIAFSSAEFAESNKFNNDYISRDSTNYVKGIFVILILFSHGKGYIELGKGFADASYTAMQNHLGQMVVSMFLFYSGFGIMEQIKKKRFDYIKTIPLKRFPNLLLNYDIAIVLFLILFFVLHKPVTVKQFLLSLIAWQGIGNSSWYIFVTFALYIATFISFFLIKFVKNPKADIVFIILMTVLNIGIIYLIDKVAHKESWWYNTAILYSLGMWYSYFRNIIEKVVMKNDIIYFSSIAVVLAAYIPAYQRIGNGLLYYDIWAVLFTVLVVLITMKVKLNSKILKWFGEHIFSIYILQRIPMIFFDYLGVSHRHKYAFLIISYAVTIPMAMVFDEFTGKLSKAIWKNKKQLKS